MSRFIEYNNNNDDDDDTFIKRHIIAPYCPSFTSLTARGTVLCLCAACMHRTIHAFWWGGSRILQWGPAGTIISNWGGHAGHTLIITVL